VRLVPLVLVGVLAAGLAACSSDEPAADRDDDTQAQSKVIQPGRPGEPNETLDPDATPEMPETNDADVMFMQMMVPHHAQALEMSELAQTRAQDQQVVDLARRIKGAQGPEIVSMSSWLQTRDEKVPETMAEAMALMSQDGHSGHGGHGGHGAGGAATMNGMLSDREMTALARAKGAEFDRLYLAGMISHHEGAVAMAHDEMEAGADTLALELAAEVAAGQQAEIGRMLDIRRRL